MRLAARLKQQFDRLEAADATRNSLIMFIIFWVPYCSPNPTCIETISIILPALQALQPTDDTRTQRLIVFYLMTALPPYLEKRKEFIFQYLKNHLDLSGLGEEVMYNQDWRSKWGPLIMCAWKAAKIGNFVAFLQVNIISCVYCIFYDKCQNVLEREISDYCA